MKIALVQVPYHLGRYATGMGKGPLAYEKAGIEALLRAQGHTVVFERLRASGRQNGIQAIVEVNKELAKAVRSAVSTGFFPLVLGEKLCLQPKRFLEDESRQRAEFLA